MKEIEPPEEKAVSGGLNPRELEYQPYDEPVPAKPPAIEVDYIPLPVPR
jgi:hypothetical protein